MVIINGMEWFLNSKRIIKKKMKLFFDMFETIVPEKFSIAAAK